jgi:hypothetical protein
MLAAAAALPAAWSLRSLAERGEDAGDRAALPEFRRPGDLDDTAAFFRAAATGGVVHLPAGRGLGSDGRYLIASTPTEHLTSGLRVEGDGMDRTVVARSYRREAPFVFFLDTGSADRSRNARGIVFSDLTIEDEVVRRGFAEYHYLIMLNGVTGARFERVAFRGFRGDALHFGSGTTLGHERHNVDVRVADCVFDGVNANNRNAISVIDCDGVVIERCRFLNCSRAGDGTLNKGDPFDPRTGVGAPGPIDFEPNDQGFPVIRNVVIRDNLFRGGGGFAVNMLLPPNDRLRTPQRSFTITGNVVEDRHGGLSCFGYAGDAALRADRAYDVVAEENTIRGCRSPFILNGMVGVRLSRNRFLDCPGHAEIGYTGANAGVRLDGNRFERCGLTPLGYALWVRTCDRLSLERNEFVDCGLAGRRFGIGLAFVAGRVTRLRLADNLFSSPTGRMTQAAVAFREADIDAATASIGPQRITFPAQPVAEALRVARG